MAKEIVVTKRFKKSSDRIYSYLLDAFSAKIAYQFLDKLENRLKFISQYPEIGALSEKEQGVRSATLQPHNKIYFRLKRNKIYFLNIIDMRRNPIHNPY